MDGVLYHIIKHPLRIGFRIFFRKIYFTNEQHLEHNGPMVLAVNHPTAFIDPVIIASNVKPTLHFILRGDVFKKGFVSFLLKQLNNIPIFRARDGFSKLRNNQDTMEAVFSKLYEGSSILILAEGQTKHEKKMRPIQKGGARMIFGAYEKYGREDIAILPIGVNYTDSHKFRSEIMIDVGEPIYLKDYLEIHKENPRKAITELTKEISVRMKQRIVHIEDSEREEAASLLMDMKSNDIPSKVLPLMDRSNGKPLQRNLSLAAHVNQLEANDFSALNENAKEYKSLLEALGIEDKAVAQPGIANPVNFIILLIGLIPFLVGYALNALPLWLAKIFADKKVKKIEFHSSLRFGVGFFGYVIYYPILAILLLLLGWKAWMVLAVPFLGWFAIFWMDLFKDWNQSREYKGLPKDTIQELLDLRNKLSEYMP